MEWGVEVAAELLLPQAVADRVASIWADPAVAFASVVFFLVGVTVISFQYPHHRSTLQADAVASELEERWTWGLLSAERDDLLKKARTQEVQHCQKPLRRMARKEDIEDELEQPRKPAAGTLRRELAGVAAEVAQRYLHRLHRHKLCCFVAAVSLERA
jgi:hypothetical protein